MRRVLSGALVVSLLCAVSPISPAQAETDEPKPVEGVAIEDVGPGRRRGTCLAQNPVGLGHAPGAHVAVMQNVAHWDDFVDSIIEVTTLPPDGPWSRYEFLVNLPWPLEDARSVLRVKSFPEAYLLDYKVEKGLHGGNLRQDVRGSAGRGGAPGSSSKTSALQGASFPGGSSKLAST